MVILVQKENIEYDKVVRERLKELFGSSFVASSEELLYAKIFRPIIILNDVRYNINDSYITDLPGLYSQEVIDLSTVFKG